MLKRNISTIKNEEKIWLNKIIFNNEYGNAFCRYFKGVKKILLFTKKIYLYNKEIIIIKLNSINKTIIVYNKLKDKVAYSFFWDSFIIEVFIILI